MNWMAIKRGLSILAGGSALLLAACGGGDKSPTGPNGGGGGSDVVQYKLVALGRAGLPADAQLEDCILTRFYSGGLKVTRDGSWEIKLQIHDDNYGDWGYKDTGTIDEDGDNTAWFDSDIADRAAISSCPGKRGAGAAGEGRRDGQARARVQRVVA